MKHLIITLLVLCCIIGCGAADPVATAQAAVPWWQDWMAIVGGGLLALLTAGKRLPGLKGLLAEVADFLWNILAPASHKEADAKQAVAAEGLDHLVAAIQRLPNDGTIGELKDKVRSRVPSEVQDYISQLVTELERRGIQSPVLLTAIGPSAAKPI